MPHTPSASRRMTTVICNECGEELAGSVFDCHHHNQSEFPDDADNIVVTCDDCPAWWILKPDEGSM